MKIIVPLLLTLSAVAQEPHPDVPVLTVCEALKDLKSYNGKDVVIVGRSAFTFEGTFMSEECESDRRVLIEGNRWLSAIGLSFDKMTDQPPRFTFDESRKFQETTALSATPKDNLFSDRWLAVFGRLVSPPILRAPRPPSARNSKNIAGNGFGANGSVPAQIIERSSFHLSKKSEIVP